MTYKDRFVVAVRCGGKILREKDGAVYLPFGSEYSLLLKNLGSRKSSIQISIDGQDVLEKKSLLLDPNSSMELERFVESLDKGNKFKFIQKTKEIVEHRGDRVDDGIIRVEFAFEQVTRYVNVIEDHYHSNPYPYYRSYPWVWHYSYAGLTSNTKVSYTCAAQSDVKGCNQVNSLSSYIPDEGITVRGSESHQHFYEGNIGTLDPSEVIIIRLRGGDFAGESIEKPITVKDKVKCETCGTSILPISNFCGKCGTAMRIM